VGKAKRAKSKRTSASKGGSRGLVGRIDKRLEELEQELGPVHELLAERQRLLEARAALTGERNGGGGLARRLTRQELVEHLRTRPGSRASVIARELGVPLGNVSQHLHRGRGESFERRADGWHVRDDAPERRAERSPTGDEAPERRAQRPHAAQENRGRRTDGWHVLGEALRGH
jgi:hypothetical protein